MNAPWLQHYDPGVPHSIGDYPRKTLVDYVAQWAAERPHATAVIFKGSRLSFRELDQASDAFAGSLRDEGVAAGDRVALILPNCPQFIIAELAVWKLGAMIAPKNPLYTDRELVEALGASKPSVAIVLSSFYERVKHLQPQTTVRRVISTNIKEYLPPLLRMLFTLFRERKEGYRVTLRDGDRQFADMLREGKPATGRPAPEDPAILLMSGGTTGTPKAVVSAHRSLVMSGLQFDAWLREALDGPNPSLMLPLPLFHTYACAGAQSITITEGIPLILVPNPRDTADVVKTIHHEKPALFTAVPALFTALLQHPLVRSGKADFSSIRGCFSGAAALMAETKRRFEALTGGTIVEGYSLTEATMACTGNPLRGANKIGSVGMPMPDVFVKIVKADDADVELPPGEVGEIVMQAPQLMLGYWNAPEETAEMLRDGLLYTGDLGYLDEDGYLFIVDRKKDLIKTSGFQVWPREIEKVLETHPAVAEAGVGGVKDERQSEIPVAWVVLREGATATPEELRSWCRQSLAAYKVPARVHIRKELPKTLIGKILRRELVAEENAQNR